ncbi:conserved hypothetical protein [Aeropyrum pernix]|uniref:DUF655 domain-containing protein n=1 Tax=Aeropyrum pernix TaxID=56636 RepID=A0A401H7U6_AERPX|nr:DUF655 domain-containing protein [Aeropyrum pernix]GBF08525.1 conserved hypothetical protein [Aeropyrum pernix]
MSRQPRPRDRKPPHQGRPQPHIAALEVEAIVLDYIPEGYPRDPHREHRSKPVVQGLGVRRLHLVDGVPLHEVDILERVTLAREVVYSVPIVARLPGGVERRVKSVTVAVTCLPGQAREGGVREIYCYPLSYADQATLEALQQLLGEGDERHRYILVDSPDKLSEVARGHGLSGKIVSAPRDPISYQDLTDVARATLPDAVRKLVREREDFFVEFFNVAEPINIRIHALEALKGVGKKMARHLLLERERRRFTSFEEVKKILKIDPAEALAEKILEEIECRDTVKYYFFVEPCDPSKPYLGYTERMWKAYAARVRARREAAGGESGS